MDRHDAISYGEAWRFWFGRYRRGSAGHGGCGRGWNDSIWQVPVGRFWTDQIRGGVKRRVRAVTDGLGRSGRVRFGGSGSDGQDVMRTGKFRLGGCGQDGQDLSGAAWSGGVRRFGIGKIGIDAARSGGCGSDGGERQGGAVKARRDTV